MGGMIAYDLDVAYRVLLVFTKMTACDQILRVRANANHLAALITNRNIRNYLLANEVIAE